MRSALLLALAVVAASSPAFAQRRTATSLHVARRVTVQQPSTNAPKVTWQAGIAIGEGEYDIGFMGGASILWDPSALPINVRFDPSLARFSADLGPAASSSILMINIPGAVEYEFRNSGTGSATPYVMGGLGLHYLNIDVEVDTPGLDFDIGKSRFDLGITIGAGLRVAEHLSFELRIVDVDGFTSIPLLVGWRR
jgi:opacity protein-like surface antigen